ncbi:hypothetical protein GCM10009794_21500 [Rothia terrae]
MRLNKASDAGNHPADSETNDCAAHEGQQEATDSMGCGNFYLVSGVFQRERKNYQRGTIVDEGFCAQNNHLTRRYSLAEGGDRGRIRRAYCCTDEQGRAERQTYQMPN